MLPLTRIRTCTYLFLLDCQFAMCIGSPPAIAIDESASDLPCSELEFSTEKLASHPSNNPSTNHRLSLKTALDLLLDENDPSVDNIPLSHDTSIFGLFTVICGTRSPTSLPPFSLSHDLINLRPPRLHPRRIPHPRPNHAPRTSSFRARPVPMESHLGLSCIEELSGRASHGGLYVVRARDLAAGAGPAKG